MNRKELNAKQLGPGKPQQIQVWKGSTWKNNYGKNNSENDDPEKDQSKT